MTVTATPAPASAPPRKPRAEGIRGLAKLLGTVETQFPHHFQDARVDLFDLIVLPQPRQTFVLIPELAYDIAQKGIFNPLVVAQLTTEAFRRYLAVVNVLWRTDFQLAAFADMARPDGQDTYYQVLLAGERRYRACRWLWDTGCEPCRSTNGGELAPGTCYLHHFGEAKVRSTLCTDITPLHALLLQLSENTHVRVPEHEEAYAYQQLIGLMREANPTFTVAAFARCVGRSADTIKRALQFCDLPAAIREAVEHGHIRYGIAIEVARLQRLGVPDEVLLWWCERAMVRRYKVPDFRGLVSKEIETRTSGQTDLLGIMTAEQERASRRLFIRQTVEREVITALWWQLRYLRSVLTLLRAGTLGHKDSPFSSRSPRRVLREILDQQELVLVHGGTLLGRRDQRRARGVATALRLLVDELDRIDPPRDGETEPQPTG
ncbi:MAG: hypothetical protein HYY50_00075 [Candidatus Kerfeldbacteria bacterium]|nr:hypothetical protein [Candidatus Kerfeldbacteria bacterium]